MSNEPRIVHETLVDQMRADQQTQVDKRNAANEPVDLAKLNAKDRELLRGTWVKLMNEYTRKANEMRRKIEQLDRTPPDRRKK